jgi:Tfp pilus assembly protein PilO
MKEWDKVFLFIIFVLFVAIVGLSVIGNVNLRKAEKYQKENETLKTQNKTYKELLMLHAKKYACYMCFLEEERY